MLAVAEPDNVEQQFFFLRLLDDAVILRPVAAQGSGPDGTATQAHQHTPHDPPHELRTNAAVHSLSSPISSVALASIRGLPMRTCCGRGRLISAGAPPTFPAEAHALGSRLLRTRLWPCRSRPPGLVVSEQRVDHVSVCVRPPTLYHDTSRTS